MKHRYSSDTIFLAGMVISMTCWGLSWSSGKVLSAYGTPLAIGFLRFASTLISLAVILLVLREKMTINRKGTLDLIIASVLLSAYNYLFFKGLTVGKAGAGGVLVTVMNPIIAYAIMLIMAWRKPSRNEAIGLILGLVSGVVLLRLTSDASQLLDAGNIYFLVAAFCWAMLSRFTARGGRYGSSVSFTFWLYVISTFIMFLTTTGQPVIPILQNGDGLFWFNLFFSSTITTALATTFYFMATVKVGASKASSFIFMVPFSAAIGSWIFLGEEIQLHTIAGGLLGIGAVYILNKRPRVAPAKV